MSSRKPTTRTFTRGRNWRSRLTSPRPACRCVFARVCAGVCARRGPGVIARHLGGRDGGASPGGGQVSPAGGGPGPVCRRGKRAGEDGQSGEAPGPGPGRPEASRDGAGPARDFPVVPRGGPGTPRGAGGASTEAEWVEGVPQAASGPRMGEGGEGSRAAPGPLPGSAAAKLGAWKPRRAQSRARADADVCYKSERTGPAGPR